MKHKMYMVQIVLNIGCFVTLVLYCEIDGVFNQMSWRVGVSFAVTQSFLHDHLSLLLLIL